MKLLKFAAIQVMVLALSGGMGEAQTWDVPARGSGWLSSQTGGKLSLNADLRGRYERRTGQGFGAETDLSAALLRNRLSVSYKPVHWLSLTGTAQDSRAPSRGLNAPGSLRNPADWLEGYVELLPEHKGFGVTVGRMMVSYGETRLLATAQWGNVTRAFDLARLYWRSDRARVELLWLSPVKTLPGAFDRPALGERVWGAYNTLPNLFGRNLVEIYALRHENNIAPARVRVNVAGGRLAGPLPQGMKYSLEAVLQNGRVGSADHRAAAWFSSLCRRWTVSGRTLDLSGEYKFASRSFDQLYPSAHDKFGHMDLIGWRNIHDARGLATLGVTKPLAVNLMYNSWWLASLRAALYSGACKPAAWSPDGVAGRHVGQELDVFATYKYQRFTFGAGIGRMFKGEFIRRATPGVEPTYFYVFHTYTL